MKIEVDEFGEIECLRIDGEAFYSEGEARFEVLASRLRNAMLSDIPKGISIQLCDPVIGSSELICRGSCHFEHTEKGLFVAHGETPFFLNDESIEVTSRLEYLESALAEGKKALTPLSHDGRLIAISESRYEDVAYLSYSVKLPDQLIFDAESYMQTIQSRLYEGFDCRSLFICHASEDKPFVERLVSELDRRALYAWFDKREILVGDSIVAKVNEGLSRARYIIVVLSPRSVQKSWVTREINSSLMRQLAAENIVVLPALLEACEIPPLLADLKYADFSNSFDEGFAALLAAIRRRDD